MHNIKVNNPDELKLKKKGTNIIIIRLYLKTHLKIN